MNNSGIKEIAKLAGVSIGTVDRVLHNRTGVSEKTKEKVLKIIKKIGYKKNIIASRLKLAANKKIQIAILIPEVKSDWSYWKLPQKGIAKAAKELQEQGISIQYFFFTSNSFSNCCEAILSENFDAIITVPFLKKESNNLLQKTVLRNIPLIFLDTEIALKYPSNYIRQNSFDAGMVAGRLLHGLVGSKGIYFVVNIQNEAGIHINNQQREDGFRNFFKQNFKEDSISIHTINQPLKSDFKVSEQLQLLLNSPQSKGFFVTNARSFLIPTFLKKQNINNTNIIGFDLNRQNLAYLKSGEISFLINQKPEYQGYAAIKGLYKFLTEQDKSELNIDIPVEIIIKENANFIETHSKF